ncbi:ABC transporter permease [Liberiplasma polymorphum]|uniref:ABC transporter permease n=1 Tax=Liberiplasma polymorphum TaxID=3374570 RepID=UPI0037710406
MQTKLFYNTKNILMTVLRKEKIKIALWVMLISGFVIGVSHAYPALFPNPEELIGLAEAMQNPMMVAMFGPVYDPENYTTAQSLGNQMLIFSMLFSAIMSIVIVAQFTRGDEEEGILELIQSLPVGRLSNTLSTVIIIVAMNVVIAILIGFGLALVPDDSMTFMGSMTFGLSIGTTGILVASMVLIIAQLFENNRTVMGLSFLVLGVMYILRGIGDLSGNVLIWIIPFNWPARVEVYINNYNYLNLLTIVFTGLLFIFAFYLNARRDLESGLIAQKKGKESASNTLKTPLGFVLRLLRPAMIAWVVTLFILGLTYGSIFGDLDTFIEGSDIFEEMLPGGDFPLNVQFMSIIMMVVAITAGIGPIMFLNRLASEEKKNHTEHIYSKSISRMRMLTIFTGIAMISSVILLFLGSLGMISGIIASMDDPIETSLILQAGFAYLPALLFMIGLSVLILGFYPNRTGLIWVYFGYSFFSVYMGNVIGLPDIFKQLTPFGYVDQLPIEDFRVLPTIILLLLATIMTISGFLGYKRRDLIG